MSVYSGFATRQMEEIYDRLLETLIKLYQKRIMKFYKCEPCNEPVFRQKLFKLGNTLFQLEKSKYMQPKYSPHII